MRTPLRSCARRQHGAFHARQALSCYSPGEVRARVSARRWIPVYGPVYRLDDSEPGPRLRVAAAGLAIGHPVPACLSTAAELHGFGILDDPVTHVSVAPELPCRRRRLLWPHQLVLQPSDLTTLPCGLVATTAVRTAIDLSRLSAPPDGLAVLDAALGAGCDRPALDAEAARHVGLRGVRQARALVELARTGPDSPQESRLRWLCHEAGLPPPTVQLPVIGRSGRTVRWIDLGWAKAKVGLEYDGEIGHDGARRRRADRRRHNGLQDDDWAMFYATDLDVYRDHAALTAKVAAALRRRGMRW
ncbi:hypothetical protein ACVGOW_31745 [Pseudonocardia saturnea]